MQSKKSFFNATIFKKYLGKTWVVGLVYFILLAVIIPINYAIDLASNYTDWGYTKEYIFLGRFTDSGYAILGFIFAIITVMFTYSYLFVKRDINMMHTFPVNRAQLFFSGICSNLVVLNVPVVLVAIIASIESFATKVGFVYVVWYWAFSLIVSNVFFMAFATVCIMLTGQAVTAMVFYGILNFVALGIEFTIRLLMETVNFGLSDLMGNLESNVLTPVVYMAANCNIVKDVKWSDTTGQILSFTVTLNGIGALFGYLIAAVVLVALAFYLYKNKKLESVNDFITVKPVRHIFTVGISFFVSAVIGSIVGSSISSTINASYSKVVVGCFVGTLASGIVIFYITQMLIDKTIRVFKKSRFIYCCVYTLCAFFVLLGIQKDVLGAEKRVPTTDEIEWAGISGIYSFVVYDEESIDLVREIHSEIISEKEEIRDWKYNIYDPDGYYFTFKYKLKDGTIVTREYYLEREDVEGRSSEYLATAEKLLAFMNNPDRIKECVIGNNYDNCKVDAMEFYKMSWNDEDGCWDMDDAINGDGPTKTDTAHYTMYDDIYEALLKDIDEGNILQSKLYYSNENEYYNEFDFTLFCQDKDWDNASEVFYGGDWMDNSSKYNYYYVDITTDSTNLIDKLLEYGIIDSKDDLITYEEANKKWEEYYSEDIDEVVTY